MQIKKTIEITAVIIFFSIFVLSLLAPIGDPDLFWHLKTGEWIWQNKTLPDRDPFSFTVEPFQYEKSVSTSFPLKQYWLAQLIIYGFYCLRGFYGIIVFRCLIYLGIGLMLYYWMGKQGWGRMSRLIFLMPSIYFSLWWLGERPNNLSFLFAVIVVYLLEDLQQSSSAEEQKSRSKLPTAYCLLPAVMLLWANMHGGFIIGDAIIAIYVFSEVLRFFYIKIKIKHKLQSTVQPSTFQPFFIVCLISILISFVNPNSYKVIPAVIELKRTYSSMLPAEMRGPFEYIESGKYIYCDYRSYCFNFTFRHKKT